MSSTQLTVNVITHLGLGGDTHAHIGDSSTAVPPSSKRLHSTVPAFKEGRTIPHLTLHSVAACQTTTLKERCECFTDKNAMLTTNNYQQGDTTTNKYCTSQVTKTQTQPPFPARLLSRLLSRLTLLRNSGSKCPKTGRDHPLEWKGAQPLASKGVGLPSNLLVRCTK